MCRFVAFLSQRGIAGSSVKSYLAAARFTQIAMGLGDPHISEWPRLGYVVRGMKKMTASRAARPRLPITPSILRQLRGVWGAMADRFNSNMLWAASCMCFFGFLRTGEVVVPSANAFDPAVHLCEGDVKVDSRASPSFLEVNIKASKTDVFRKGVKVVLGVSGADLCPVAAILSYMALPKPKAGPPPSPFFTFSDGSPLTRDRLVRELRAALRSAGVEADHYAGHSFRIGAATTAAAHGLPDSLIKTLGRWESAAYLLYIRTPQSTLRGVASSLVKAV